MSTANRTRVNVPAHFDTYVDVNCEPLTDGERSNSPNGARCTGCFRGPAIARLGANLYCEPCLRAMHACDLEEERMVRSIVGGAVRGALHAGASLDLVHAVVAEAVETS
jgi:hypothetical protein